MKNTFTKTAISTFVVEYQKTKGFFQWTEEEYNALSVPKKK
jgi:hypothetical protein